MTAWRRRPTLRGDADRAARSSDARSSSGATTCSSSSTAGWTTSRPVTASSCCSPARPASARRASSGAIRRKAEARGFVGRRGRGGAAGPRRAGLVDPRPGPLDGRAARVRDARAAALLELDKAVLEAEHAQRRRLVMETVELILGVAAGPDDAVVRGPPVGRRREPRDHRRAGAPVARSAAAARPATTGSRTSRAGRACATGASRLHHPADRRGAPARRRSTPPRRPWSRRSSSTPACRPRAMSRPRSTSGRTASRSTSRSCSARSAPRRAPTARRSARPTSRTRSRMRSSPGWRGCRPRRRRPPAPGRSSAGASCPEVLAGIMDVPPGALEAPLQELVDQFVLDPPGLRGLYDFRHQLLRDALYRTIPASERRRFHARAGEFGARLEGASEIHASVHYERAGLRREAFDAALAGRPRGRAAVCPPRGVRALSTRRRQHARRPRSGRTRLDPRRATPTRPRRSRRTSVGRASAHERAARIPARRAAGPGDRGALDDRRRSWRREGRPRRPSGWRSLRERLGRARGAARRRPTCCDARAADRDRPGDRLHSMRGRCPRRASSSTTAARHRRRARRRRVADDRRLEGRAAPTSSTATSRADSTRSGDVAEAGETCRLGRHAASPRSATRRLVAAAASTTATADRLDRRGPSLRGFDRAVALRPPHARDLGHGVVGRRRSGRGRSAGRDRPSPTRAAGAAPSMARWALGYVGLARGDLAGATARADRSARVRRDDGGDRAHPAAAVGSGRGGARRPAIRTGPSRICRDALERAGRSGSGSCSRRSS